MLSGQNREAVSDLEDAMKFLKKVYYEELNGYDGNNVHYILDILLARENLSVLKFSRATAGYNKTVSYTSNRNSNINNSIIYAFKNSLKPMIKNTYPNSGMIKKIERDTIVQQDQSLIRQIRRLSDEKSGKSKDKPKEPIWAETLIPAYSRNEVILTERNRDFICYRLNDYVDLKHPSNSRSILPSPPSSILTNSNKWDDGGKLGKYFSYFQIPLHFKHRHHNHFFRRFMKSKHSTHPIPKSQDGFEDTRKINSNIVDRIISYLENNFFFDLKVIKVMKILESNCLQVLFYAEKRTAWNIHYFLEWHQTLKFWTYGR